MNEMIKKAMHLYDVKEMNYQLNELGNSSNLIIDVGDYILRISNKPIENLMIYQAELEWLNYLDHQGVRVSNGVLSKNNRLVEIIKEKSNTYFVSLFDKATGNLANINNKDDWNDDLFNQWGRIMGKMHHLAKNYPKKLPFFDWNENISHEGFLIEDEEVLKKWIEVNNELSKLDMNKDTYGLIHYDLHQNNFFVDNGKMTLFDFDGCRYHFFIYDIAISLYHAVQGIPKNEREKRELFAYQFLNAYLKGYREENSLNSEWICKLPLFLKYRRIFSYGFINHLWKDIEKEEWQSALLKTMKDEILYDIPYIDIDFKKIA